MFLLCWLKVMVILEVQMSDICQSHTRNVKCQEIWFNKMLHLLKRTPIVLVLCSKMLSLHLPFVRSDGSFFYSITSWPFKNIVSYVHISCCPWSGTSSWWMVVSFVCAYQNLYQIFLNFVTNSTVKAFLLFVHD